MVELFQKLITPAFIVALLVAIGDELLPLLDGGEVNLRTVIKVVLVAVLGLLKRSPLPALPVV